MFRAPKKTKLHTTAATAVGSGIASILMLLLAAPSASAVAWPIAVYAPHQISSTQLQGWANLSRDCSNTYGCWNYIQIDVHRWYGWTMVNGWWANNNGWNSITAELLPGCYDYRTRTDSYNDSVQPIGGSVSAGSVGVSANGSKIYEWHKEWNSGPARICSSQ
jgi:hypothetical protein